MQYPIICTSPYLRTTSHTKTVAIDMFSALDRKGIEHIELNNTNDFWCRDYMPVSLFDDGYYARYIYRPDYLWDKKSKHKYISDQSEVARNLCINTPSNMDIIFDGGNYVRCGDKVIITDKILTENPQWPLHVLMQHLHESLMADIIMLPWDMDDPCGHSDGMVASLPDGRLLLNNYRQTAKGRKQRFYKRLLKILEPHFDLVELSYNCTLEDDSWCYLNYLKVPGAVLLPCVSIGAKCDNDQCALETFRQLFPNEEIIPIYSEALIKRGGALHCVTWEYYQCDNRIDQRTKSSQCI